MRFANRVLSAVLLLSLLPVSALCWDGLPDSVDARLFIRAGVSGGRAPDFPPLYGRRNFTTVAEEARVILGYSGGEHFAIEAHIYQSYISTSGSGAVFAHPFAGVERSSDLVWVGQRESDRQMIGGIDRLNVRLSAGVADLRIGRQPINLATTYYFTPNDLFAPFMADAFFRDYKEGVDGARLDVLLGELSQFSLIGVRGYAPDAASVTGWSGRGDSGRDGIVARLVGNISGFEMGLMGGRQNRVSLVGGSLQGELFDWLGLRAEGHHADPEQAGLDSYAKVSVGLEHRFENSLNLKAEYFFNGSGATSASFYNLAVPYPARQYAGFGAGYEFTPLLLGEALAVWNMIDGSMLFSLYGVYSLSDEAEFSISVAVPSGREPAGNVVRSGFGLYPVTGALELRIYF